MSENKKRAKEWLSGTLLAQCARIVAWVLEKYPNANAQEMAWRIKRGDHAPPAIQEAKAVDGPNSHAVGGAGQEGRMRALLVYATGETEWRDDAAPANEWLLNGTRFAMAGIAVDRNTMVDGHQLHGANGTPNNGTLVYVQIRPADACDC